jgi:hypothetical protein
LVRQPLGHAVIHSVANDFLFQEIFDSGDLLREGTVEAADHQCLQNSGRQQSSTQINTCNDGNMLVLLLVEVSQWSSTISFNTRSAAE